MEVRFGSRIAALLFFYLPIFLALAYKAIPAIAPPELINPVTHIAQINVNRGAYITTITHRQRICSEALCVCRQARICWKCRGESEASPWTPGSQELGTPQKRKKERCRCAPNQIDIPIPTHIHATRWKILSMSCI